MSKGWYVKVEVPVQFHMDCNIGVVASHEYGAGEAAIEIVRSELKKTVDQLRDNFPWEFKTGALEWNRGCETLDPLYGEMSVSSCTPDADFDPDNPNPRDLMDAAMCLMEAFFDLPDSDARRSDFLPNHGIAVVRDQIATAASLCHQTWLWLHERDEYDDCFDWDFCPRFLDRCMDDQLVLKSGDLTELLMMWKGEK